VQSTWSYYGIEKLGWDTKMIGISLAVIGVLVAGVQGGLIRVIIPKLGQEKSLYTGLAMYGIGLLLFAFATSTWMMFAFAVIYCLGGIAGPALQGIISAHVPMNEQGELQGALTSLMSLTSIMGPLMMTHLFHYMTSPGAPVYFPGGPFLLGSVFMLLSAWLAYRSLLKDHAQGVHF
jgi:DHA1 family tetracycline resistance protein-like MFS transporter